MKKDVHFANVDMEIKSKAGLQQLIDALRSDVYVLYHERLENGLDFASLEFHLDKIEAGFNDEPDLIINEFYQLIVNLEPEARKIWDNCQEKKFDIGIESGNSDKTFNTNIKIETVKRIAEIGADIVITIYPAR